ncbi:Muskelin N-terminus-domain-containing protein [Sporodiniella umbellata]|nr:Muskelin N-terminus-domain-containing protein [Sporodiniella umbellata]
MSDTLCNKGGKFIKEPRSLPYLSSNQREYRSLNETVVQARHYVDPAQDSTLSYTIHAYSSYSLYYHPRNIRENDPKNQLSRWSSGTQGNHQFITLKLDCPVIARSIMFGKYHQSHVCNLKEFKVFGSLDPEENMIELLHGGLKNDNESENFLLSHRHKNKVFPVQYIKLVPLAAYGTNFNYSVWYIELKGIDDQNTVKNFSQDFINFKENEIMRLCLKYFRQKNFLDVFYLLKNRVDTQLEHPVISDLYQQLVLNGKFDAAENTLRILLETGVFEDFCETSNYTTEWKQLKQDVALVGRGGHQMCIDTNRQALFVFGGYNGKEDLGDCWRYNIIEKKWVALTPQSEIDPRSCHKMCYDPKSDAFYVLGRYKNLTEKTLSNLNSELFKYDVKKNSWIRLSDNTAKESGPDLIFDHQMCIDSRDSTIYISGGKVISANVGSPEYSGLYSYKIETNQWNSLRVMGTNTTENLLFERAGHSMFIDQTNNCLYLFSGQRAHECFYDLFRYNLLDGSFTNIEHGYKEEFSREAGFAHWMTFDEKKQEIHMLASYTRSKKWEKIKNVLYVYSIKRNSWQPIYENESRYTDSSCTKQPSPRYALQMLYDPNTCNHYIFGGNPGISNNEDMRLGDLWELKLKKPDPYSIYKQCLFMIRAQKLKELSAEASSELETKSKKKISEALAYLRDKVSPLVNLEDPTQTHELEDLCLSLCLLKTPKAEKSYEAKFYSERIEVFERILIYIPEDMKEPAEQLTSSIKMN